MKERRGWDGDEGLKGDWRGKRRATKEKRHKINAFPPREFWGFRTATLLFPGENMSEMREGGKVEV